MHAAGQEVAISILAARYMRVMIPGLAFAAVNESLKRYLMAQNVVIPETIAVLFSTALSPLYNQILVVWAGEAAQSGKLMHPSIFKLRLRLYRDSQCAACLRHVPICRLCCSKHSISKRHQSTGILAMWAA